MPSVKLPASKVKAYREDMLVRLTDELKAQVAEEVSKYKPTRPALLVGSCVWLGEGRDIDVVVFVEDSKADRGGDRGGRAAYGGMATYRHGPVNIIAVDDERIWAGWRYAAEVMPDVPRALIEDKRYRVAACEKLRKLGEKQCPSA